MPSWAHIYIAFAHSTRSLHAAIVRFNNSIIILWRQHRCQPHLTVISLRKHTANWHVYNVTVQSAWARVCSHKFYVIICSQTSEQANELGKWFKRYFFFSLVFLLILGGCAFCKYIMKFKYRKVHIDLTHSKFSTENPFPAFGWRHPWHIVCKAADAMKSYLNKRLCARVAHVWLLLHFHTKWHKVLRCWRAVVAWMWACVCAKMP